MSSERDMSPLFSYNGICKKYDNSSNIINIFWGKQFNNRKAVGVTLLIAEKSFELIGVIRNIGDFDEKSSATFLQNSPFVLSRSAPSIYSPPISKSPGGILASTISYKTVEFENKYHLL